MPGHQHTNAAGAFTGKLNVMRAVQKRLAHKQHMDGRACHVLRNYVKSFVLDLAERLSLSDSGSGMPVETLVEFVSTDDKASIPVGNPHFKVSTEVRANRGSIVPAASRDTGSSRVAGVIENAGDHGFGFANAKAAVGLFKKLPKNLTDSWLKGEVWVVLREGVFGKSSGWMHAVELVLQLLQRAKERTSLVDITFNTLVEFEALSDDMKSTIFSQLPAAVVISTDGGGDNKNTFVQNQAAVVAMQQYLKITKIVLFRNAPGPPTNEPSIRWPPSS